MSFAVSSAARRTGTRAACHGKVYDMQLTFHPGLNHNSIQLTQDATYKPRVKKEGSDMDKRCARDQEVAWMERRSTKTAPSAALAWPPSGNRSPKHPKAFLQKPTRSPCVSATRYIQRRDTPPYSTCTPCPGLLHRHLEPLLGCLQG